MLTFGKDKTMAFTLFAGTEITAQMLINNNSIDK